MEKIQELMQQYIQQGFVISTNLVGNTLHVVVKDSEGVISEEFDIVKFSSN